MVGNLGRDFWIIKSGQYEFFIIVIRKICSCLLQELKSGVGEVFILIWCEANSIKSFIVLFQFVQLLQDF